MKRILAVTFLFAIVAPSGLEASMQRKTKQQRQDAEQSKEDRERPSSGAQSGKGDRPLPGGPCCETKAEQAKKLKKMPGKRTPPTGRPLLRDHRH